jgi:hypothetical protein
MTQKEMILDYLQRAKEQGLTSKEAEDYFGCMRLASRISDLRKDGHVIDSKMVKVRSRSGFAYVARYTIHGAETDAE